MGFLPPTDRRQRILALGLPIIGGMLSQNVLNVVDTAMVGSLGDIALAATGMGGFANFMAISVVTGFVSSVAGLYLSFHADLPTGPSIVVVATGLFLAAMLFSPSKGVVWQAWRPSSLPVEEAGA